MGYSNLAREEADKMAKRSEQKLLLVCVLFVFVCLLLSGGSRLIGSDVQVDPMPARSFASIRAVLSSPVERHAETGCAPGRSQSTQRVQINPAPENRSLQRIALCDANGNVIGEKTYMRAVYQAFVLGDGFV